MTETVEDRERRYLVPVARLNLPTEPDVIHLSVYQWLPAFQAWATGMAICGASTKQGALLESTVTCEGCLAYRARYERMLAPGYRPEDDDPEVLRERLAAAEETLQTLAPMFEGLARLLSTSSRDWGEYRVDAWLWAVLLGWDCEQETHDETCVHGALEEMQKAHGWDDTAVAKARRYRAAVRAVEALNEEEGR